VAGLALDGHGAVEDRQERLYPCSVVDADDLHVDLSHALGYVSELLIGHRRPSVGRPAIRLSSVEVVRQFIGLGFGGWRERDAGDRLHADLIQAVCSLWEALDGALKAHCRRSDRQGLDEAAATDVDLPRRRVGHWQQARLVHIENRLQIGGVAQLPSPGCCAGSARCSPTRSPCRSA
jgi:hypothetical protein